VPLWGFYILTFGKISVKFSVFGVLYPYRCTDWFEIWHAHAAPPALRGEKKIKIGNAAGNDAQRAV